MEAPRCPLIVWAHVNFLNLFNDDPQDTGVAGVDIYRMDGDGKAIIADGDDAVDDDPSFGELARDLTEVFSQRH